LHGSEPHRFPGAILVASLLIKTSMLHIIERKLITRQISRFVPALRFVPCNSICITLHAAKHAVHIKSLQGQSGLWCTWTSRETETGIHAYRSSMSGDQEHAKLLLQQADSQPKLRNRAFICRNVVPQPMLDLLHLLHVDICFAQLCHFVLTFLMHGLDGVLQ
jgi:hypothetical protein